MTGQKPTVGRIVLYRMEGGVVRPAIVTNVGPSGLVDLEVFTALAAERFQKHVGEDPGPNPPDHTWHWPPRE